MEPHSQKLLYDPESKILSIKLLNRKSVDSDVKNNVVLDYDKEGNIVNIDIMQISIEEMKNKSLEKIKIYR